MFMGDSSNRRDIGYTMFRVANCFDIYRTRVLIDSLIKFVRIMAHHPFDFNLELFQIDPELVETATVYLPRGASVLY